jgi:hypothetical protein
MGITTSRRPITMSALRVSYYPYRRVAENAFRRPAPPGR